MSKFDEDHDYLITKTSTGELVMFNQGRALPINSLDGKVVRIVASSKHGGVRLKTLVEIKKAEKNEV